MSNLEAASDPAPSRDRMARLVIWLAGIGLTVIALVAIAAAVVYGFYADSPERALDAVQLVFNSLLPLFGTWVGTVIAYYFSKDNFETAARGTRELISQMAPGTRLDNLPVRDLMVARPRMEVVEIPAGGNDASVSLKTSFIDRLKGRITRMPVLNPDGSARYIVHKATLYQYVYDKTFEQPPPVPPFDPATATLQDLANHPGILPTIARTLAFAPRDATLGRVKEAMDRVPGCQDVFVTATGAATEPVEGWLTNSTIAEAVKP